MDHSVTNDICYVWWKYNNRKLEKKEERLSSQAAESQAFTCGLASHGAELHITAVRRKINSKKKKRVDALLPAEFKNYISIYMYLSLFC